MSGSRNLIGILIVFLTAGFLHACNYPETSSSTEESGACSPDALLAPEPLSPAKLAVVLDSAPEFLWEYPAECDPEKFNIEVVYHPLVGIHEVVMDVGVEGFRRIWTSDKFLSEANHYGWRITAVSGTARGPSSDYAFFFTGPICEESPRVAPELIFPRQEAMIDQRRPWLLWRYSETCLPDTFYVELADSPVFADENLVDEVEFPAWGRVAKEPLTDCTQYFWRVAAQMGEQLGPFSPTWHFWTDFSGACDFAPVRMQE